MRRRYRVLWVILAPIVLSAGGPGPALAADGSLAGSFAVNNELPAGWELSALLMAEGSPEVVASQTVRAEGSAVGFSFTGLDPGPYRVRLAAGREGTILGLGETTTLEVGAGAAGPVQGSWKAMGSGGGVSGEIELLGEPPAGRMILIRARRVDIDLEGKFPDQLNAATIEVEPDQIEAGSAAYEFAGLSYGLYAVELIAYDYESHTTQPIDAYAERLVIDLDHEEHEGIDFAVEFP